MNARAQWPRVRRRLAARLGAAVLAVCGGAAAQTTFPIQQAFTTNAAAGWTLGGSATLTGGGADPSGSGWLRLTSNATNQTGYAFLNTSFPSTQGVMVDFDFTSWGGTGADGISFFLFDGATATPRIGAFGGSLGYAQKTRASGAVTTDIPGVAGGYVGIGLDEFGNFSNATEGRVGGPGQVADSVSMRGPGNGASTTDYPYLTGAAAGFSIDIPNVTARPAQTGATYRHARLIIEPNKTVSVYVTNGSNAPTAIISGYKMSATTPSTLKLGFGASTGGSTNYHEIRNLQITQPTDLSITKTDGVSSVVAGQPVTYTLTVTNGGQTTVTGAAVTDTVPSDLTGVTWSCTATAGSTCGAASGSGNAISTTATLAGGGSATYAVQATVGDSALGPITNTASVGVPSAYTDQNLGNNSATDTDTVQPRLQVSKAFSPASVVAGGVSTLTVTVTNPYAVAASALALTDDLAGTMGLSRPLPLRLTATTCGGTVTTSAGAATLTAGGAATESSDGVLKLTGGTVAAGSTCSLSVQVTVPDAGAATRTNTIPAANVTATVGTQAATAAANATATLTTTAGSAGAALTCDARFYQLRQDATTLLTTLSTLDRRSLASGGTAVWSAGFGPGLNALAYNKADGYFYAVNSTPFASGVPFRLYRLGAGGAVEVSGATLGIPTGSSVAAAAIDAGGTLYVKKAASDAVLYRYAIASGTASTLTLGSSVALNDLAVNPLDGLLYGVSTPGGVYRITPSTGAVTVSGSPAAAAADGSNVLGSAFFDVTGALYAAQHGGPFGTVNLGTGAFTAQGSGPAAAQADGASCAFPDNRVDVVKSVGSVTAQSATVFDIPYTVTVKNTGPVSDPNVQLTENLAQTFSAGSPALGLVAGPSVTSGSATVNAAFTGSGDTRLLSGTTALAAGASVTVTFTVRVTYPTQASVPASTTVLNNSVIATSTGTAPNDGYAGGLPPVDVLATDTSTNAAAPPATANGDAAGPTPVTLPTVADLTLTKTDGVGSVPALGTTTYTLTLTNSGPGSASGTVLTDPAAAELIKTGVSCAAAGGAVCPAVTVAGLEGGVTIATLPAGGSVTLTVPASVSATSGPVSNSVTAALPAGTVDVTPVGTVTDTDTVTPVTDVAVSQGVSRAFAGPGQTLTYTIRVWNNGPNAASTASITDTIPAVLSGVTWTCAPTGSATCSAASGSGNTVSVGATLPVDSAATTTADTQYVTVTVTGTLSSTASGTVSTTAGVSHPNDTTPANNSAAVSTAIVDAVNDSAVSFAYGTGGTVTVLGNDTVGGAAATTSSSVVTISANGGLSGLGVNASGQLVVPGTASAGTYPVTYRLCSVTDASACDTATVGITVGAAQANLGITKTGPAYAQPAQDLTYTLTVTNAGPDAAGSVTVTDTLPAALTYKSSTPAATVSGQTLTWTAASLASGATWTLTLVATAPGPATLESTPAARTVTNTATVTGATADPVSGNNSASATTAMVYGTLGKTVRNVTTGSVFTTSGGGLPGQVLEYCIAYGNYGGVALPNFTITDQVPGTTTALPAAYDADEPSAATGFGVKLVRGGVTTYLSSAADTDAGALSTAGGTFARGTMSAALGTLNPGENGSACFQVTIR